SILVLPVSQPVPGRVVGEAFFFVRSPADGGAVGVQRAGSVANNLIQAVISVGFVLSADGDEVLPPSPVGCPIKAPLPAVHDLPGRGLDPTHRLHPPEAVVAAIGIARTSVRCARCRQVAQLDARLGIDDAEVAGQARKMVVYEGGLVLPDALKPAEV